MDTGGPQSSQCHEVAGRHTTCPPECQCPGSLVPEPLGVPIIVDGGVMDDVVHLLFIRQDGGLFRRQRNLLCPTMRHAAEPQETAILLDHQRHRRELHRHVAVVEGPPQPTLDDSSAVVTTGWLRPQVVGDRCDLVGV